ncbi:MalY/PatB family protein [Salipaludibacillus sp. CF4.18]|uniref:MalY/PatB family protein n=1 Tax=Salipaludibacillus sp. CF4.18 TaxID=3373081 RepID=UPI003EE57802
MKDFFEENVERKGTASFKWDMTKEVFKTDTDVLPMWVADMDFRPPKAITDALHARVEHGIYGYTYIGDSVVEAITSWLSRRVNWDIKKEWILYSNGVVPSIGKAIQALTQPGDKIMIQSPVYPPFFSMVKENDRVIENCPLVEEQDQYGIDFDAFEASLKTGVKMFILCHPHNPIGRVWTETELRKMADLCMENDVIIVSDEIHSDLVLKPFKHVPMASLSEEIAQQTITLIAPSKTFNLAGLQASISITPNKGFREKIQDVDKKLGFHTLNTFGILAMEMGYRHGEEWLEGLLDYLKGNVETVDNYFTEHLPELKLVPTQATYLLWIDCRKLELSDAKLNKLFVEDGKVGFNPGTSFGKGGEGFVRMNVACPQATVLEGLKRMKKAIKG